jgi:NitT/TauT family transport system permease protein
MTLLNPTPGRPAGDRSQAWKYAFRHLLVFIVIMAAWEAFVQAGGVDALILPAPSTIAAAFYKIAISSGLIWSHFGLTMWEALMGFVIGSVIGVGLAIAAALWEPFRRYVSPYVNALQVTPRIALAPLVIAWLGFGLSPKIAIAALVCFFPPFINTLTGLLDVDQDKLEMFRSLRARRKQIFFELMLPEALPIIMAGLKTAMSFALIGAIVAEFVSASAGMGILMQRFTFALNMSASFAVLFCLMLMGLLLFWVMEIADNRLVFWRHDARLAQISRKQAAKFARFMPARKTTPAAQPAPAE